MGFSTSDTIVAIATPPGRGGLGVVRLSGPDAAAIAAARLIARRSPLEPRRATFTTIALGSLRTLRNNTQGAHGAQRADGANDSHGAHDAPDLSRAALRSTPDRPTVAADVSAAHVVGAPRNAGSSSAAAVRLREGSAEAARDFVLPPAIDQAVVTYFPGPHSYTGEDVVEISAHGSPVVLRAIVAEAVAGGARLAAPGEFTLRAFLNGRIDLPQAEAVADLIDAVTPLQARAAFDQLQGTLTGVIADIDAALFDLIARLEASIDFPDEGYHFIDPSVLSAAIDEIRERTVVLLNDGSRGRIVREGRQVAIVGKPNVGKSSVFNALVGAARAIVTDVAGTTRDLVTESLDLEGLHVTLVDTAGLRSTVDIVEAEGVARAKQAQAVADLTLVVLDRSSALDENDVEIVGQLADNNRLIVANKIDIVSGWRDADEAIARNAVLVSATSGRGVPELRRRICAALDIDLVRERPHITNVRHVALVERALGALTRARDAARAEGGPLSEEFVLADLQDARAAFEEVTGRRTSDDVLAHIFSRFCVGK